MLKQKRSSFPRRRKSNILVSPVLSVSLHGSPAFAEDDNGLGGMLEQKRSSFPRRRTPPYTYNKKKGDPKIPPQRFFVPYRLLKQPNHITGVVVGLAGHRYPDLLQHLQAGQFGHLG
jgi:hypothetical protein